MEAVVVSHNSASDLRALLQCAPLRSAFSRIVVVDNASTDDSMQIARSGGATVIDRGVNDSLPAPINEGMRACSSEVVAILNPDVLVDDAATVEALAEAFVDSGVGLVAPRLRLPDGRLQDSARAVPSPVELVERRLKGTERGVIEPTRRDAEVPWVVAAFVLVRRTAFWSVGGFDERYRLYFEDVDFCVRLWSAGWRVQVDADLVVRHEHQASSRRSLTGWAMRRHVRSALRFFSAHPDLLFAAGRRRLVRSRPTDASARPR